MHTRDEYGEDDQLLSEVIFESDFKGIQIRLTVSEFRGKYYLGLRKWVVNLEEDWLPTKQGFSWPYSLETTSALFKALTLILSKAEVLHEVVEGLHYEFEPDANIEDPKHPRFLAGFAAGVNSTLDKESIPLD